MSTAVSLGVFSLSTGITQGSESTMKILKTLNHLSDKGFMGSFTHTLAPHLTPTYTPRTHTHSEA